MNGQFRAGYRAANEAAARLADERASVLEPASHLHGYTPSNTATDIARRIREIQAPKAAADDVEDVERELLAQLSQMRTQMARLESMLATRVRTVPGSDPLSNRQHSAREGKS